MPEPNERATPHGDGANGQTAAPPADELEALRARAEAAEKALQQAQEQALRTRADFDNYQKRASRDAAQERRYAQVPLAGDLLPALDNLERATAAARQVGESGPLVQGVAMVQSQLQDILRRHGITRVEAQGQPFDPNHHEAVSQQPTSEFPPNTVVQVLEQGYLVHDRVLRPARVVVSAPPQEVAVKP